jgi:hypothetical protein
MKVYVDELPKENELFIGKDIPPLKLPNPTKESRVAQGKGIEKISLTSEEFADFIRQEKQIVCDEIKQEVKRLIESKDFKLCNHEYANGYCYGLQYDLAKILDQIQGETK